MSLIAISGFSFWFVIAFPWANHNESYGLVVQLEQLSFADTVTSILYPTPTFRPLTQMVTYGLYMIFGHSLSGAQLFNFLTAALAWATLLHGVRDKSTFSLVAFWVGGFLFPGYIYLFHLHGVCYSPILLFIGVLFHFSDQPLTTMAICATFLLTLIFGLFHTLAFGLYVAFIAGSVIAQRKRFTSRQLGLLTTFCVLCIALMRVLLSGYENPMGLVHSGTFTQHIASFRMLEVHWSIAIACLMLTLFTLLTMRLTKVETVGFSALIIATSVVSFYLSIPIVIIWIGITLVKAIVKQEWPIAFMLTASSLFALTRHGSPTHALFAVMIASAVAAEGWTADAKLKFAWSRLSLSIIVAVFSVGFALRCGYHVPVLSNLAHPILAEKEKTFQLEKLISMVVASEYKDYHIAFTSPAATPREAEDAVDRKHRPPTQEEYINAYLFYLCSGKTLCKDYQRNMTNRLLITFGSQMLPKQRSVFTVEAKFAGRAAVWAPFLDKNP